MTKKTTKSLTARMVYRATVLRLWRVTFLASLGQGRSAQAATHDADTAIAAYLEAVKVANAAG